ncbi:unnamed protein product [Peronospora farinosa]|uniref:Uncharacterized protein n=1 Tax=Peronospora farinosa TaxID=134698 RepID=A0AAV0T2D1_9STRA|nr:unnamed protein product [Peronospora farinosa]
MSSTTRGIPATHQIMILSVTTALFTEAVPHETEGPPDHRAMMAEAGVSAQAPAELLQVVKCLCETVQQMQTCLQSLEQSRIRVERLLDLLVQMISADDLGARALAFTWNGSHVA